ncbi:MAG: cytidine deaminase [Verrucomicrobiota bacterium]|nr:cytidine deaminase [Verrucomicrobiota bacterium]MDQ6939402.1 cytidine deaminase [Verrucomicrobiota bacterium]
MQNVDSEAIKTARLSQSKAYAPYSKFAVGAALVTSDGAHFSGCNVENRSYGLTMCAERVAVGAAVSKGNTRFVLLALVSDSDRPVVPCGACRQVLAEFAPMLRILSQARTGEVEEFALDTLLPLPTQGILD